MRRAGPGRCTASGSCCGATEIDVDIDLFHQAEPGVDWTRFGPRRIDDVEWVIVALSRAWRERWEGRNPPTEGAGAVAEADALKSLFARDQDAFRRKVVLVTLPSRRGEDLVPIGLDGVQRRGLRDYSRGEVTPLIRLLTNQPEYPAAPLGGSPELPPVEPPPIDPVRQQPTASNADPRRPELTSEPLQEIDEQIGAIEEALALTPQPEAADGPNLPASRAWRQLNDRLAALERARAEINPRQAINEPPVQPTSRTIGEPGRSPSSNDSGLRAAAQRLRYDIEAQRRKIARSLDLTVYWREPRSREVFQRYGPTLMEQRPLVWDPVSFAYMWFEELNESVELGARIRVGQSQRLQQGIDQLAHASAALRELIVELSQASVGLNSQPSSGESAVRAPIAPSLTPELLRARVFPYHYLPVVESTEKALCIRTVAAVGVPKQVTADDRNPSAGKLRGAHTGFVIREVDQDRDRALGTDIRPEHLLASSEPHTKHDPDTRTHRIADLPSRLADRRSCRHQPRPLPLHTARGPRLGEPRPDRPPQPIS